jgi:putative hydrolase of the HAD superfamily
MQRSVLLFDLGGVLVDLADPVSSIGLNMTSEEFWALWLSSPLVHQFETGKLTTDEFVARFGAELGFADALEFDRALRRWHLPMFHGAAEALGELTKDYTVALLSNTNEIHWQQVASQTNVFAKFDHLFLSYATGNLKPEPAAFHDVVAHFDCAPADVFFFDDNAANVAAARQEGLQAIQVSGWDSVAKAVAKVL